MALKKAEKSHFRYSIYAAITATSVALMTITDFLGNIFGIVGYFRTPEAEENKDAPAVTNSEPENMKKLILGLIKSLDNCPEALDLAVSVIEHSDIRVDSEAIIKIMGDINSEQQNNDMKGN